VCFESRLHRKNEDSRRARESALIDPRSTRFSPSLKCATLMHITRTTPIVARRAMSRRPCTGTHGLSRTQMGALLSLRIWRRRQTTPLTQDAGDARYFPVACQGDNSCDLILLSDSAGPRTQGVLGTRRSTARRLDIQSISVCVSGMGKSRACAGSNAHLCRSVELLAHGFLRPHLLNLPLRVSF